MSLATYAWLRLVMPAHCVDCFVMSVDAAARDLGFASLWLVCLVVIWLSSSSEMGGLTLVGIVGVSLRVLFRDS